MRAIKSSGSAGCFTSCLTSCFTSRLSQLLPCFVCCVVFALVGAFVFVLVLFSRFFFFARCCLGKVPGGAPFSQLHKGIGSITRTGQLMHLYRSCFPGE